MKNTILTILFLSVNILCCAQRESFDIISYVPLPGWQKEVKENLVIYSITDNKKKSWCQIGIIKSTISKGSIEADFESEWNELIVNNYKPDDNPQFSDIDELDEWKIKTGKVSFKFNNATAIAMLTTVSGYARCVSIVATTNNPDYNNEIENLLSSVELITTEKVITAEANEKASTEFRFTTTNFDDGWISTAQKDWVEVTKGTTRILIHYPNKLADAYNSVLMDGLKNAWNILVAPKYSSGSNFSFRPIQSWQSIEFAEADLTEKLTAKKVHVVLFKMNYSNGSGKYLEFITPDKASFEREFGQYHETSYGWEKMENMAFRNKFAIAPSDLKGKWTNNFSGSIQYVNAYTGFDAGLSTQASVENFIFNSDNTYKWDLGVASGMVGNIKFQSVKSTGKFTLPDNWKIYFSDMEGKPKTYDAYFSCIKGFRILWIDNKAYGKIEE